MTVRAKSILFLVATAIVCSGTVPASAAEYLIPPSNSAATQYTEAVPTAGGHRDSEREGEQRGRSPSQVLGDRNAEKLESHGRDGRAAAEFAAETSPAGAGGAPSDGGGGGGSAAGGRSGTDAAASGGSSSASGSDGLTEVLGTAVGDSSGGLGLLFPLALLGGMAWAVWFGAQARRRENS
jgi:hypothetical protein